MFKLQNGIIATINALHRKYFGERAKYAISITFTVRLNKVTSKLANDSF